MTPEFDRWERSLLTPAWQAAVFSDPLLNRWQRAAAQAAQQVHLFSGGSLDIATLTRQVLRRESLQQNREIEVTFPNGEFWPTAAQWASCGVSVLKEQDTRLRVRAVPWKPAFAVEDPSEASTAERHRRQQDPVTADPLFEQITGFPTYSSPGQRQALRAVWYAAPGATIAAILPTGSGKSAVAHVPALGHVREGRLSILVVPTIALALDQERAVLNLAERAEVRLPARLAYHSGISPLEREAFRERIRTGQQGVLITSPEQMVGSLSSALYHAAASGSLAQLTLDEAHLASQWGADFRPHFQLLAGLRRALLRSMPDGHGFTTLLLSATLTAQDLDTLRHLFAGPGRFDVIAGVKLRAEPEYWAAHLRSRDERQRALDDAVLHVPKPAVVYTTEVEDAQAHAARFRKAGLRRVGCLTGQSTTKEREQVVSRWRQGDLDLVVGTSAFGVGIDQAHVRTVIHACVPESADRYYQEVGRGGRDGRTSLALTLSAPSDWETAKGMAVRRLITVERGLARWKRMFSAAWQVTSFVFDVDIRLNPPHLHYEGATSRTWNLSTLTLMARAGLIRLLHPPLPELDGVDDDQRVTLLDTYNATQRVEVRRAGHQEPQEWETQVEPVRQREIAEGLLSLDALKALLLGEREAGDVLTKVYAVGGDLAIYPQHACGGCPVCRDNHTAPDPGVDPDPAVPYWAPVPADLQSWYGPQQAGLVVIDHHNGLLTVVRRCVEAGAVVVFDPGQHLGRAEVSALQAVARAPLLIEADLTFLPDLPAVLILPEAYDAAPDSWFAPGHVILAWPHQTHLQSGEPLTGHPNILITHWGR